MFTLAGFCDAVEHTALAPIDAMADPYLKVSGDDLYIPTQNKLMAVLAAGAGMSQCRLQSPSLRRLANQRIASLIAASIPREGYESTFIHDYHLNPRTLDVAEALNAYCVNIGTNPEWVLVWLMDTLAPLPAGEIFSIEATVTVTGVFAHWVNGAMTFSQTLPAGRYTIVGLRAEDSNVVAIRLVFPDIPQRPGVPGSKNYGCPSIPLFRQGRLGNWGEFEHDAAPSVDILVNTAGEVTPEIIFDLIQIRAGRR